MKIKTQKDFWEVADMWYQRTMRLQEIANSGEGSLVRRGKAHLLFIRMMARMNAMIEKAIEITRPSVPPKMEPGGINYKKPVQK